MIRDGIKLSTTNAEKILMLMMNFVLKEFPMFYLSTLKEKSYFKDTHQKDQTWQRILIIF